MIRAAAERQMSPCNSIKKFVIDDLCGVEVRV